MMPAGLDPRIAALARDPALTPEAARRVAEEFEQMFLTAMLAPVFETVPTDGGFGGGHAEESWRGLLIEEYAGEIARSGGIGLADLVYRELLALQEEASS